MSTSISFSRTLWRYSAGKGSWYFVTLPKEDRDFIRWVEEKKVVGFGFIKVRAKVGESEWETTLFPSKEHESYLLSINAKIRKIESLHEGDEVEVYVELI